MTMMTMMTTEEVIVDKDATEVKEDVAMVDAVMEGAVKVDAEDLANARASQIASS